MKQRKIPRSTWLPIVLLIYLCAMSAIGWKGYRTGENSSLYYFGIIAFTFIIIVLLHFFLRKRERLNRNK